MAVTQNEYTGNGSATTYSFTFPYLQTTDVKVKLDGVTQATTAYTFPTATTVQMNSAPGNNVKVLIYRDTGNDNKKATFYPGSAIKAEDLNDDFDQILYTAQEIDNYAMTTLGDDTMIGNLQMGENQLVFEGATADAHETSIGVVDPTADRTINFPNVSGNVVTTGDTGTVTATMLANVSVNTTELVDSAITTDKINTAAVTTAKIAADAVTGAKIADDQINSEHYVASSIDTEHIGNLQVTAGKLAADCIDQSKIADNAVLTEHISNANITVDKLATSSVQTAKIADNAVTTAKINADAITGAKIADDQINSEHYIDGSIDTAHLADDAVTTAKIAANAVTTSELADAELTTLAGMQSGTASILASGTALTATNAEINAVCDGKTVQTTISDTDASYPTSGAVVDYVAAQIAPLGGLEVIANEDSFPTQPSSGVVISIADAGGIVVNGSGVSTTARTSGNGSDNVTINGFPSSLYSTTLAANMGLLVSSTGSSNTYTYHKLLGKEDDIKQLSDDINDFAARYRVASSAPSSNNDDGDLYFDTSTKKMKVYNGSTSQWDDVAQSSSSHIVTLSESFNGSLTDFTMSTAATDAQSTIVSINGVIQKPNAGTSTPSEGFAISGNTLKLSNAPATGSTYFVVVLGDTVSIGTPSDNTVSTAKIQNLAVTGDKIATNLDLADNKKIRVGTGNDLEIYHDGNSYVTNTTANQLAVQSNDLKLRSYTDLENYLVATHNGSVDLYYNGTKTFYTDTYGAIVVAPENGAAELQIWGDEGDDNNDKYMLDVYDGRFRIKNYTSGSWETNIECNGDGNVELYYDGVKKLETASDKVMFSAHAKVAANDTYDLGAAGAKWRNLYLNDALVMPDDGKLLLGAGEDLKIHHDGTKNIWVAAQGHHSHFYANGVPEEGIIIKASAEVELYYDNSKKLETYSYGVKTEGHVWLSRDNDKAYFGAGSDLQIFHSGNHSQVVHDGTGNLYIDAIGASVNLRSGNNAGGVHNSVVCNMNAGVELYYDNIKQCETNSGGMNWADGKRAYFGDSSDLQIYHDGTDSIVSNTAGNLRFFQPNSNNMTLYPSGVLSLYGNEASGYAFTVHNDGDNNNRYGIRITCGQDTPDQTNIGMAIRDGDGTTQGSITFSGGSVTYGTFTAYHPCIVPDSENPSDSSNAYLYGTLLETISIEYTQKNGSNTERGIRYKVQKTQSANSRKVLGAYGGSMNGGPDGQTNEHQALVLGDGHILVNNAGGNIEVGDGICSSATAGIGQKATANPSMIIGIAQEAVTFTGSETKLVAVQYGLQQFIPWT